jgi:hypothetical protein
VRQDHHEAEALAACEAALKVRPDYQDADHLRIQVLLDLKRYDDVIRSCDALLAQDKTWAAVYELRGLARAGLKLSTGPANASANAPLVLPASVMAGAIPITIGSTVSADLTGAGAAFYEIEAGSDGRLIAPAQAGSGSLQLRLSLYDGQGNLLVQSDGQSSGRPDPLIDQHVAAGADVLEVQDLSGSGTFSLSTSLTSSSDPGQTVELSPNFQGVGGPGDYLRIAVGDFTNNGILDMVAPDGVHLGTGDGTFEAPTASAALVDPSLNDYPSAIAVGDFNGDGDLDVVVALSATDSVAISMDNGNGTFQTATTIGLPTGREPDAIVAGDLLGNGRTDLAVADFGAHAVSILLGNGNGTFQVLPPIAVGQGPDAITEGDFENNGRIDLAVADFGLTSSQRGAGAQDKSRPRSIRSPNPLKHAPTLNGTSKTPSTPNCSTWRCIA